MKTIANSEASNEAPKDLHGSEAVPPKQFNPGNDDRRTPGHCVERLERLFPAKPLEPLDQEFEIGLDRTEIDVLGITSRHEWVVIVWHDDRYATSWLTTGYDEG
jgi:hypothetical protein